LRSSITLKNLFLFFFLPFLCHSSRTLPIPNHSTLFSSDGGLKGFLIIPKKVEQNQTKVFDRDKPTLGRNFTVPNAISDYSKGSSSFKVVKGATNSSSSSGLVATPAVASNSSSNQLNGSAEVESETIFTTANFTNITAQVGSIVEIPCTVLHLGEGTVS
jgi:activator of HSP90 ATPase